MRTATSAAAITALLAVLSPAASADHDHDRARQVVDGQVLIVGGELLNNPPDAVLQTHHDSRRYLNSHLTYGFDLTSATVGGSFTVDQRHAEVQGTAGGDTWAITFLDRRLGERGARVVAYVDGRGRQELESGTIPIGARSAYVTATHGINQAFRYTAVGPSTVRS